MKKLYKKFGIENIPKLVKSIDLNACSRITENSPEYQQIIENPELLPGVQQATQVTESRI